MTGLFFLPPELKEHIFDFCQVTDLINLSCCSKWWKKALKYRIWKKVNITHASLVRQRFGFFASKRKFKNLAFTRNLTFIDSSRTGRQVCHPNYFKIVKYISAHALTSLVLDGCFITDGSIVSIGRFTNLQKLTLLGRLGPRSFPNRQRLSVSVFDTICGLKSLRELKMDYIELKEDSDPLSLQSGGSSGSGAVIDFSALSHLRSLVCSEGNLKEFDCSSIGNCKQLRKIDFSNSKVTDGGVSTFGGLHLTSLNLSCAGVSDEGISSISAISTLEQLTISSTQITNEGVRLLSRIPSLHTLHMNACSKITDQGISNLAYIKSLKKLNISGTMGMTANGLADLGLLYNLVELDVHGCFLWDSAVCEIGKFRCLEVLDISHNHVTDFCLGDLKSLKSLRKLKCLHTQVTQIGLTQLDKNIDIEHDNNNGIGDLWPLMVLYFAENYLNM